MKQRWVGVVLLLVILLIFGSCRTPAGRTPGQVVDDVTITTKVKAKLFNDDFLKGLAISVDTFQGEVTLTGAVDNEQQRDRAETVSKSVAAVLKVNNLLKIKK